MEEAFLPFKRETARIVLTISMLVHNLVGTVLKTRVDNFLDNLVSKYSHNLLQDK